jgi:hypothetical protein
MIKVGVKVKCDKYLGMEGIYEITIMESSMQQPLVVDGRDHQRLRLTTIPQMYHYLAKLNHIC